MPPTASSGLTVGLRLRNSMHSLLHGPPMRRNFSLMPCSSDHLETNHGLEFATPLPIVRWTKSSQSTQSVSRPPQPSADCLRGRVLFGFEFRENIDQYFLATMASMSWQWILSLPVSSTTSPCSSVCVKPALRSHEGVVPCGAKGGQSLDSSTAAFTLFASPRNCLALRIAL